MRERLGNPDLLKLVRSHAERYKPTRVLVEDSGLGNALFQDLRRAGLNAIAIKPQRDKVTRRGRKRQSSTAAGIWPRQAHWLGDSLDELLSVPNARFDDQVDALCQALAYVEDSSHPGWDDRATRNLSNFIEALAFDASFEPSLIGILTNY